MHLCARQGSGHHGVGWLPCADALERLSKSSQLQARTERPGQAPLSCDPWPLTTPCPCSGSAMAALHRWDPCCRACRASCPGVWTVKWSRVGNSWARDQVWAQGFTTREASQAALRLKGPGAQQSRTLAGRTRVNFSCVWHPGKEGQLWSGAGPGPVLSSAQLAVGLWASYLTSLSLLPLFCSL